MVAIGTRSLGGRPRARRPGGAGGRACAPRPPRRSHRRARGSACARIGLTKRVTSRGLVGWCCCGSGLTENSACGAMIALYSRIVCAWRPCASEPKACAPRYNEPEASRREQRKWRRLNWNAKLVLLLWWRRWQIGHARQRGDRNVHARSGSCPCSASTTRPREEERRPTRVHRSP